LFFYSKRAWWWIHGIGAAALSHFKNITAHPHHQGTPADASIKILLYAFLLSFSLENGIVIEKDGSTITVFSSSNYNSSKNSAGAIIVEQNQLRLVFIRVRPTPPGAHTPFLAQLCRESISFSAAALSTSGSTLSDEPGFYFFYLYLLSYFLLQVLLYQRMIDFPFFIFFRLGNSV
jgi:hypothetical protein